MNSCNFRIMRKCERLTQKDDIKCEIFCVKLSHFITSCPIMSGSLVTDKTLIAVISQLPKICIRIEY